MRSYLKQRGLLLCAIAFIWIMYHVYYMYLSPVKSNAGDIYYLDTLICVILMIFIGMDYIRLWKTKKGIDELCESDDYIMMNDIDRPLYEYASIFAHNEQMYNQDIEESYQKLCELQEYISRWSHEIKLPLAALQMMNERNDDVMLRGEMKEQFEKMEQLLHTMLTGCKTWNTHYDKKIEVLSLKEIVDKSIRHQSFFLIKQHFLVDNQITTEKVLSDEQWLVYMLDQIIHNAVKYHKENPTLSVYTEIKGNRTILHIRDNGIGIYKKDLLSVFEKGYTGDNARNGEYKSTGMGLYFVKQIARMLEHQIEIESIPHEYTDVQIIFDHHLDFFNITEL